VVNTGRFLFADLKRIALIVSTLSGASECHHRSIRTWLVHRDDIRHRPAFPERLAFLVGRLIRLVMGGGYPAAGWSRYRGHLVSVRPNLHHAVIRSAAGGQ
jgi:hypothetical protein